MGVPLPVTTQRVPVILGSDGRPLHRATAGIGFDVTTTSRTRRQPPMVTGLYAGADRHLTSHHLAGLRELCRGWDRNSSIFSGLLDTACDNIVGSELDFIPHTGDAETDKLVKAYIWERMEPANASADGNRSFEEITRDTLRAQWTDGDMLHVKQADGTVMTFEADQILDPMGSTPGGSGGKLRITCGVEKDARGRTIAYHVSQREAASKSARVPAANAFYISYRTRFSQTRGVPFTSSSLAAFDRLDQYMDYETTAAMLNAMLGFQIKRESNDQWGGSANTDTRTNDVYDQLQRMEPAMIFDLLPNESIEMVGSARPGGNYPQFVLLCLRIVGVGVGYPLELLLKDFSKTNYSSARASLAEARRGFRNWQRRLAQWLCEPWYKWQIARGIASGAIPPIDATTVQIQWPSWQYIDPVKDATGDTIAIDARLKSISQCIRDRGGEPGEVFREIQEERELLTKLGILPEPATPATPAPAPPAKREDDNDDPEDDDDDDKDEKEEAE